MGKKHIIIALAAGLLSFGGAFGVMFMLGGSKQPTPPAEASEQPVADTTQQTDEVESTNTQEEDK